MGFTFQLLNDPVTFPLDHKLEFVDDLILLCFELAGEYDPILLRGSVGLLQNVLSKIVSFQIGIAWFGLTRAMPLNAG